MNPAARNVLLGGTVAVIATLLVTFLSWVAPLQAQIATLSQQVQQATTGANLDQIKLQALEATDSIVTARLDKLALYDLRHEEKPKDIEEVRCNNDLTQLVEILAASTISVDTLDPVASDDIPIRMTGVMAPLAIISKRVYQLTATGLYGDWISALARLRKLPPTVSVSHYEMEYLSKVGERAKIGVKMDVAFNFLLSPSGSASSAAGGSGIMARMLQSLGGKQSALPTPDRMVALARDWLCPPALASTLRRADDHRRHGGISRPRPRVRRRGQERQRTRVRARRFRSRLARRRGLRSWHSRRAALRAWRIARLRRAERAAWRSKIRRTAAKRARHQAQVARRRARDAGGASVIRVVSLPDPIIRRVSIGPPPSDPIERVQLQPLAGSSRRPGPSVLEASIWRVSVPAPGQPLTIRPELAQLSALPGALHLPLGSAARQHQGAAAGLGPEAAVWSDVAGAVSAQASAAPDLITMPIPSDNVALGRAEPFLPIIDATDDASLQRWEEEQRAKAARAAKAAGLLLGPPPVPTPPPHHDIQILGILQIGPSSEAMVRIDGVPAQVGVGSQIGTGYTVRSISSNFCLIDTPSGLRRYDLTRTWQPQVIKESPTPPPPPPARAASAGTSAAVPAPPPLPSAR